MAMARRTLAVEGRRRRRFAFVSGGAVAAALAVAVLTAVFFGGTGSMSAEGRIVLQQVNGAHNASIGIPATDEIDPVDIEIAEALWSR